MELKLKNTIQDTIDSAIIVRRLSGIEKKTTLRRRIIYVIYLIISSGLLFMTIKSKLLGTSIFTCVLLLISCANIIFPKKINNRLYKKNVLKNYKIISKNYNHDFLEPTDFNLKIENGFVETETLGSITRYALKDYIRYFCEDRFCIFEFKNGKYIFININDISKEQLEEVCKEFEKK